MTIDRSIRPRTVPVAGLIADPYLGPGDQWMRWPRTAAEGLAVFGRTPSDIHLCEDAGSPLVAAVGGENLTRVNQEPTYQVATPYAGKRGVGVANGTATTFRPAAAATWSDDGVTSFAHLSFHRFGNVEGEGNVYGIGKNNVPTNWWTWRIDNAGIMWLVIKDGTTSKNASLPANSLTDTDTWVWESIDRTADLAWVATRYGAQSVDISGLGAFDLGTTKFRLGWSLGANAEQDVLYHARFEGANAEGDPTDTLQRAGRYVDG